MLPPSYDPEKVFEKALLLSQFFSRLARFVCPVEKKIKKRPTDINSSWQIIYLGKIKMISYSCTYIEIEITNINFTYTRIRLV